MLKVLDTLEQHPHFYRRTVASCVLDEGESGSDASSKQPANTVESITCEVYLMTNFRPELLTLPHHSSYADDPKRPYMCTTDREDASRDWWHEVKADH